MAAFKVFEIQKSLETVHSRREWGGGGGAEAPGDRVQWAAK